MIKVCWIEDKGYYFALLANHITMNSIYFQVIDKELGSDVKQYYVSGSGVLSDISPLKDNNLVLWVYSNAIEIIDATDKNSVTRRTLTPNLSIRKVECHRGVAKIIYPHMFAIYEHSETTRSIMFGTMDINPWPFEWRGSFTPDEEVIEMINPKDSDYLVFLTSQKVTVLNYLEYMPTASV